MLSCTSLHTIQPHCTHCTVPNYLTPLRSASKEFSKFPACSQYFCWGLFWDTTACRWVKTTKLHGIPNLWMCKSLEKMIYLLKRYIVQRSLIHCRRAKRTIITRSHLPNLPSSNFALSHKLHDFREECIQPKIWCWCFLRLLPETILLLRIQRAITNVHSCSCKVQLIWSDFNDNLVFWVSLEKNLNIKFL
jgi:hypothetical protein